jgi:TRAP-type C4-dicarboxylate transport system permease small subunit
MIVRVIDRIYSASGALAAFFMVMIAVLTLAQIVGRLFGIQVRDAGEFAGFAMAASSFLALAYTLRTGGHIRVSLLITRLHGRAQRIAEGWCLLFATVAVGFFAWYSISMVWQSHELGDVSTGMIGVPLWIPQIGMALGIVLLEVAFLEECVRFCRGGEPTYRNIEADDHFE